MKWINDPSQSENWPRRKVTSVANLVEVSESNRNIKMQFVTLDCEHYCIHVKNPASPQTIKAGDSLGCRSCYKEVN